MYDKADELAEWIFQNYVNKPSGMAAPFSELRYKLRTFIKEYQTKGDWHAERVMQWMNDPNRKPANLAFTAGPERDVAYTFEHLIDKCKS